MPEAPPPPSPDGAVIIERVYRFAAAVKTMYPAPPDDMRPAMIITMDEAFTLVDHLKKGPWQLAVQMPLPRGTPGQTVPFDLRIAPKRGVMWASLFGIALIIDSDVYPES